MGRIIDTNAYLDAVCRMLREGETAVPVPVQGVSMRPFLRNADFAFLDAIREPVKKGDIVLFQRRNGRYILHRVYRLRPDGGFLMLGDSQLVPEPVDADQLRGRAAYVRCRGVEVRPGSFRWWFFAYPWRWLAPWRRIIGKVHGMLKKEK